MTIFSKILSLFGSSESKEQVQASVPRFRLPIEITKLVDGPDALLQSAPIKGVIVDRKNSDDGSEYYLVDLDAELLIDDVAINYLLISTNLVGGAISPGMTELAVNIALVVDESLLNDSAMDFSKSKFATVGFATAVFDNN